MKGKTEPLQVWQPLAARARFGADVIRTSATPLVGREFELSQLIAMFERAASQRSCQLVTIVGEPGVGKTRLCTELLQYVEERPGLVRWRQGRCLPVRRGDRLLGAWGDRQGGVRHPRVGFPGGGLEQARRGPRPR